MRNTMAVLLAIIVIALAFAGTTVIGASLVPHEDPSIAEGYFNISIPLLHYGDIFEMLAEKNYSRARELIKELDLDSVNLPVELCFIMSRYSDLGTELTDALDELEATLGRCEELLSQNMLEETVLEIENAKKLVSMVRALINDIDIATEELFSALVPFVSAGDLQAVNTAKERLQRALDRLAILEALYLERLQTIEIEAEGEPARALIATELTMEISPTRVWVGEQVTVSGVLRSTDGPVGMKELSIYLEGVSFSSIPTTSSGSYSISFALPYWYIPEIKVQAFYIPIGSDLEKYAASSSRAEEIITLYNSTEPKIEVPDKAYPGLPVEMAGSLKSEGNIAGRIINTLLDGEHLFTAVTDDNGNFKHHGILDRKIQTGEHKLGFFISADNKSRTAGTSFYRTLPVIKISPEMDIRIPRFVFLPQHIEVTGQSFPPVFIHGEIAVAGELYSTLALREAELTMEMAGFATKNIINEGIFQVYMELPFSFNIVGYQQVKAKLLPSDSWHFPITKTARIFVINVVYLAIILLTLILAIVFLFLRLPVVFRNPRRRAHGILYISPLPDDQKRPRISLFRPQAADNKGIIIYAYYLAVAAVQKLSGIIFQPQMTVREFSNHAKSTLGRMARLFTNLTSLAERALYSHHMLDKEEASSAKEAAEELGRGEKDDNP
jgi:hypothetical protein